MVFEAGAGVAIAYVFAEAGIQAPQRFSIC